MSKKERNLAVGAAVGAGIGYLAGILTARKSGKETRSDIASATVAAKNKAEKNIKLLHSDLVSMLKDGEAMLKNTTSSTHAGLGKALDTAKVARDSTREILSAIHEGDSTTDADLKKAINEANKAVEHLKKFISKDRPSTK
jgi:gas vesicle protein